jgi:hypothetical protein
MIDEYLSHQAGCHTIEVRTVLPFGHVLPNHSQVAFMNQFRRLESVLALSSLTYLAATSVALDNEWHQLIQGKLVAALQSTSSRVTSDC